MGLIDILMPQHVEVRGAKVVRLGINDERKLKPVNTQALLAQLRRRPMTSAGVANVMGYDPLATRTIITRLKRRGLVEMAGTMNTRAKNGKLETLWRAL